MASTGTFLFHPELAELVDDAFEQAGVDPAKLSARHLRSAARSAELMMGSWFNRGWKQWTMASVDEAVVLDQASFTLPAGGWDIFHATVEDATGNERELGAISRADYNAIHDKSITGEPDRYFVDRSTFLGADPSSTVYLYQVPNGPFTVHVWYIRRTEDVGKIGNTLDLPWNWKEAFTVGLAYRLAKKFPSQDGARAMGLAAESEELFRLAMHTERELADAVFSVGVGGRRRGRR